MLPIIDSVLGIVKSFVPDPDKQAELKKALMKHEAELESKFLEYARMDHELRIKEIEHTGFKASWRPYVMFGFSTIVMLYCILYYLLPGVFAYFPDLKVNRLGLLDPIVVDDALWDLVKYSILGIGGMRTIDKWRKS
jgi:hypothetical protein